ncbi:MAG: hypothetical protein BZY75_02665 [SAR202 cluster bacterium Io17-Chloro-G7]|nr:MAG: hypothetical protein BZY75_02665 [SAR202 cluster bacterium Io17-Chloro-G7]
MPETTKVILDTDPGVDDAIAILMAMASPELELVGITTVGGNVRLARATRNALALLEYAGRQEVPVAKGAARPLRGRYGYSYSFHGRTGLSRRLPRPSYRAIDTKAVGFLGQKLQSQPGQYTLVALGPLTNLAHMMMEYPDALSQSASIVVMGGAVDCPGNVTPHAEFNFYSDPMAADKVMASGIPMTLVDLGSSRQTFITREEVEGLKSTSSIGRLAVQILKNWFRRDPKRMRFEFYDPLALAAALRPELITVRQVALGVENSDQERLGQSMVESNIGPVSMAERVDAKEFSVLFDDLFCLNRR